MEMEEIVKLIIAVIFLTIVAGVFIFLFKGKGGDVLEAIRNIFRFGG